jgi:hypothetical protein
MVTLYPDQLWLEVPPEVCQTARQTVNAQAYSNPAAVERAYRNLICQTVIADWLRDDPDLPSPVSWLSPQEQSAIWEFVNGSILLLNRTRLALILSDAINPDELIVEQEWVDIPDWASHYYLAVQLNLQEGWLRVSGYTTHNKLKQQGIYDALDRTYSLDQSQLIEDLTVLWVARESSPAWMPTVAALPSLSAAIANTLITQHSQSRLTSPRLDLPPEQWLALVSNPVWQENLYQQRINPPSISESLEIAASEQQKTAQSVEKFTLSQWLQNMIEPGWQAIHEMGYLFSPHKYVMARGTAPQEKSIQFGEYTLGLIVACYRSLTTEETSRDPNAAVEITIRVGIRLIQGLIPLTESLEVTFILNDESVDSTTFPIQFESSEPVVLLPKLSGVPGNEFTLIIKLGTLQHPVHFTI